MSLQIDFKWIGGATFILTIDGVKIAVDPVLCAKGTVQDYFWFKSMRIEEPIYTTHDFKNVDLWLITHNHEDHLDEIGLSQIDENATIISNSNASKILKNNHKKNITVLNWHQTKEITIDNLHIKVQAIPAIHGVNPISALFAGKVNGYYVTITKGDDKANIYITGDTVYKSKIITALLNKPVDLLIANMGAAKQGSWVMTLTLNAKMLQKMIDKLQPKMVIPVHYGTFEHYKESKQKIMDLNNETIHFVAVGEKFDWYKYLG